MGAQPGDLVYLLASLSPNPTLIPGLVSLDLGSGGLALIQLPIQVIPASDGFVTTSIPITAVPAFSSFYFQAAVIEIAAPSLPAPVTNLQFGLKTF